MINTEIRRFMDGARAKFPELTISLFKDFRGMFVAICGIEMHEFRLKMPIPDPKVMRVMWFPSSESCGFTLMIDNPRFAITEDVA